MVALGTTGIGPRREAGGTTIAGRSSGGASSQDVGLAAVWVRLAPTVMPSEIAPIVSSAWVMSLRLPCEPMITSCDTPVRPIAPGTSIQNDGRNVTWAGG